MGLLDLGLESLRSFKMSLKCYHCAKEIPFKEDQDIGRSEDCPSCNTSLRCCRMCKFYDKSAYNECREPMADRVLDKEKANFCDFFKAGSSARYRLRAKMICSQRPTLFSKNKNN